jgi:hypothetical protein
MNYIMQYHKLINIKPDYHKLIAPYLKPSKKRFVFNVEELELWHIKEFNVFSETKKGGNEDKKILCIELG